MVDQEPENLAELCPRNFTEIKRAFVRTAKYLQTRSEDFIYSLQANCGVFVTIQLLHGERMEEIVHEKNSLVVDGVEHFFYVRIGQILLKCFEEFVLKHPQRKLVDLFCDIFERTAASISFDLYRDERVS